MILYSAKSTALLLHSLGLFLHYIPSTTAHDSTACTHGKLYIFDNSTSNVHVFDPSHVDSDTPLTEETTFSLPASGAAQLVVYGAPADPLIVQYRGVESEGFAGYVRVIDTGYDAATNTYAAEPSVYANAMIDDCHRAIHQARNDGKIAIFCDGAFDFDPQVNTTVHIVDEALLRDGNASAVVHSVVLEGTHHGVAIPVDDNHLLHSLALPERVLREPESSSLPSTFQVVDYATGTLVHALADTSNPDTHCAGFHGSAALDATTFLLACDAVHGGMVVVEYNAAADEYTSRAISYPDDEAYAEGLRVGSYAYHKKAPYVVGSWSSFTSTEFYLVSIAAGMTTIGESNILQLPTTTRQCGYMYEVGAGEYLLVFMPNGYMYVYWIDPENGSFEQVAEEEIVPGMSACSEAEFVAGISQAFVATPATDMVYTVDLSALDEGLKVYPSTLPFTPTGMTISGFALDTACEIPEENKPDTSAVGGKIAISSGAVMLGLLVTLFALH